MKRWLKILGYGLLAWLVPFLASVPFYSREGVLAVDVFLFKTIMILVGSLTATILLVVYFRKVSAHYLREGVVVGVVWVLLNWLLDFVVLLPMSGMPLGQYFVEIGLRYLVALITAVALGYLLAKKAV